MIEIKIIAQCIEKYLHKTETSFGPFFYYPLISSVLSKTLDLSQICFTVVEGIFQLQGNVSALSSVFFLILILFLFYLFFLSNYWNQPQAYINQQYKWFSGIVL